MVACIGLVLYADNCHLHCPNIVKFVDKAQIKYMDGFMQYFKDILTTNDLELIKLGGHSYSHDFLHFGVKTH